MTTETLGSAASRRSAMDNMWEQGNDMCYTDLLKGQGFHGNMQPRSEEVEGVVGQCQPALPKALGRQSVCRGRGASKRNKNFSISEDEVLCSAYLNVSKDPIVGVNQPVGCYWSRMEQRYNEHKKTAQARTMSSLQHRWGDIQRDTSRFCGFFAKVERRNASGKSEDDKVNRSRILI
jgi:hypothetical protein